MKKSDIIHKNGMEYILYWKTALDGKTFCRVKVHDPIRKTSYDYMYYFRTKKAAKIHILST